MDELIKNLLDQGWSIRRIALYLHMSYMRIWRSLHADEERERLAIYRKTNKGRKAHNKNALLSYHRRKKE